MLGNLAREGVVESVDLDAGKVVVSFGEEQTPPIDWLMNVGDTTIWIAPTVGQQVTVICPEGDIERAFMVGGLASSEMAPLFLGVSVGIRFKDGATITYDPETKRLELMLTGEAALTAPEGVKLIANVAVEGDMTVTGSIKAEGDIASAQTITAETDVVGAGKSLKGHKHLGVQAGSGVSGAPQ